MESDVHPGIGAQGHDIKGICMGKIDGIVVMRKDTLARLVQV